MKKLLPAITLFFLAPVLGELLLGSAPPAEFFSLFGLTVLPVLYGGGAILVRELVIRWRKGWASLLVLGAAYGIIEEGLMVKSFFDPNWVDIGILGSYGRWLGVNWIWVLELTIYHAVISITIPILLTELIFIGRRNESWIGRKGFIIVLLFFTADIVFGYLALTTYRPDTLLYLLTVIVVIALILLAWRLPRQLFAPKTTALRKPFRYWLIGFLGTVIFFLTFWVVPHTGLPPFITILIGIGLVVLVIWLVMHLSGNGTVWAEMHRFALGTGPLSLFIILTPIHEFVTDRSDNPAGMTLVGLAVLIFLLWLRRRVKRY
jgi:hypothetical protein